MPSFDQMAPAEAAAVFITSAIGDRACSRQRDAEEKQAVYVLARQMLVAPDAVLSRFVDIAMSMTGSASAGLSLYSEETPEILLWGHLRGKLEPLSGTRFPIDSPCGVAMLSGAYQLSTYPERAFRWLADADISLPEVLHIPLGDTDRPLGVLWMVADEPGHFDSEDARLTTELGSFVGIALTMARNQMRLSAALDEQAMLAGEMVHRVKNVLTVASALVHMSARGATSVEDMTQSLAGRLHALSCAQDLVRISRVPEGRKEHLDLARLVEDVIKPYAQPRDDREPRFHVEGASVACGETTLNNFALVLHELATNALKYGALAQVGGAVRIAWDLDDDDLMFRWVEHGTEAIQAPPATAGFGSKLIQDVIVRRMSGRFDLEWRSQGVAVAITVPRNTVAF